MLSGCVWTLFFRQSGANKRELAEEHMIKVDFRENYNGNGNMEWRGEWSVFGKYQGFSFALYYVYSVKVTLPHWYDCYSVSAYI